MANALDMSPETQGKFITLSELLLTNPGKWSWSEDDEDLLTNGVVDIGIEYDQVVVWVDGEVDSILVGTVNQMVNGLGSTIRAILAASRLDLNDEAANRAEVLGEKG